VGIPPASLFLSYPFFTSDRNDVPKVKIPSANLVDCLSPRTTSSNPKGSGREIKIKGCNKKEKKRIKKPIL